MKYYKINRMLLGVTLSLLTFSACSDWDDHYDTTGNNSGVSLWEAISSNSSLSNFAKVVKATGYDAALESSQVFTVFAPSNDNFSEAQADSLIQLYNAQKAENIKDKDNQAIKEFVQNHIALYNHSVATNGSDSIVMMNGKYISLTPTTFGGENIITSNQLEKNGILFTLNNKVNYTPNIYEYLKSDPDLDSIASFFYEYNKYEFDASKSVAGEIVNGETVYLDSVANLENKLFNEVGKLNDEDSTYWMVTPTNKVWSELIDKTTNYYNYDNTVDKRDSLQRVYSRLAIIGGTVFSRTRNTDASIQDSALSTNAPTYYERYWYWGDYSKKYYQFDKPFNAGNIFSDTKDMQCSNGIVKKADTWVIKPTQTYYQVLKPEAESRSNLKLLDEENTTSALTTMSIIKASSSNPFYDKISDHQFADIMPVNSSARPSATFYVPNVLSNIPYDVYIVMVPALAEDTLASDIDRLPTRIRVTLGYHDQNGKAVEERLSGTNDVITRPDVVDTILVKSNVVIPTCSYGLSTPQVTMQFESRVTSSQRNKIYTRAIRLDCIIFKPHVE